MSESSKTPTDSPSDPAPLEAEPAGRHEPARSQHPEAAEARNLQVAPGKRVVPSERYPVDLPVVLRWDGSDRPRTAVDVSMQGLFVESPDHLPLGESVQLICNLPGGVSMQVLVLVDRVVLAEEAAFCGGLPGMGLSFVVLEAELEERWADYLHHLGEGTLPAEPDPIRTEHTREVSLIKLTRRGSDRRPARFRVRMASQASLESFYTKNVSRGGMFIATPNPLDVGQVVSLFVVHPISAREYSMEATVRWTCGRDDPRGPGVGVELVQTAQADAEDFLRFVNSG